MDIPILASALIGLGFYCHHLLNRLRDLLDQCESLNDVCVSMAQELAELGSPNVHFFGKETENKETPP